MREQTRAALEDMALRLEVVRSASTICATALRHQNCEIDEDVANVLQRNVGDKVGEEIERLNHIVSTLEPEPPPSPVTRICDALQARDR